MHLNETHAKIRQESRMPGKTADMLAAKCRPRNQVTYQTLSL